MLGMYVCMLVTNDPIYKYMITHGIQYVYDKIGQ